MGREVRRVPKSWEHPKHADGRYKPLHAHSFAEGFADYKDERESFKGTIEEFLNDYGQPPVPEDYMPDWTEEEKTHYQMYENVSEGTPISPPCESPEALASWLTINGASAFAGMTATYEQWLRTCKEGYAPSMVFDFQNGIRSGVEG